MKKKIMKHLFTFIAAAAFAVALFFGYRLFQKEMDYKKGQEQLDTIYAVMESAEEEVIVSDTGVDEEEIRRQKRLAQYQAVHKQNEDVVGWVRIENTVIDYPVMHTPDRPEFYLNHGFDKTSSSSGMIFMDEECSLEPVSANLLIYGHHMRNGSMFAEIESYDDPEFWKAHPYIEFDTLTSFGKYQVIGAFKRPGQKLDEAFKTMLMAQTEETFGQLMDYIKQWRFYDTGVEAAWGDQLITLMTCEYTQADGRFFVIAKKVEE